MNWRGLMFWRRPPIADLDALAGFIDERAAFLVQKGIHDYARALSGHYAKVLFKEEEFLATLEESRWRAYPLGLAMVGEIVEGVLRRHAGEDTTRHLHGMSGLVLSVFDRYPPPAALGAQPWREARGELKGRLQLLGLHPPKRAIDIPEPYARTYWDLMPIHKEAKSRDFPTTRSYLKVMLCSIHDELVNRADVPNLAQQLRDAGGDGRAGPEGP